MYIGASPASSWCFDDGVLIFLSNGEEHAEVRGVLMNALHGLGAAEREEDGLLVPEVNTNGSSGHDPSVDELIVLNVLARVFEARPSSNLIALVAEYYSVGGLCAMGTIAERLLSSSLEQVQAIRKELFVFAKTSPAGERVLKACRDKGWGEAKALKVLQSTVDGVLFAGLLGTGQLTRQTLERIRSDPAKQLPLYLRSQEDYLLESARLDPPVTSVTHVLPKAAIVDLFDGQPPLRLFPGATKQVIISTANRDPLVFGGRAGSRRYAESFDPTRENLDLMLSWNGLLKNVRKRSGPRWCLGHQLSMRVAKEVIDHLKPKEPQTLPQHTTDETTTNAASASSASGIGADSMEIDFIADVISAVAFLFAALYVFVSASGGPVAASFVHLMLALSLNRVGAALGLHWFEFGARCYEAGAGYFLRLEFVRRRDLKDETKGGSRWSNVLDVLNLLVRVSAPLILIAMLEFHFPGEFPMFDAIAKSVVGPSHFFVCLSFAEHWGTNGWLLSEMIGMLACLTMFTPLLEAVLYFNLIKPTIFVTTRMLFTVTVGLPLLSLTIVRLDAPTPEVFAEEDCLEGAAIRVTDEHRRKAREYAKEIRKAQRSSLARASAVVVLVLAIAIGALLQKGTVKVADGQLCPFGVPGTHTNDSALCEYGVLKGMDIHTRFMYMLTHYLYLGDEEEPPPTTISVPADDVHITTSQLGFGTGLTKDGSALGVIEAEKEKFNIFNITREQLHAKVTIALHQYMNSLPLIDYDETWPSVELGREIMRLADGGNLPRQLAEWKDMQSDEAITRICFAGLFAHRLELCTMRQGSANTICPDGAKFVVDFTFMDGLEVRVPFERYGSAAYFDSSRKLMGIYWSHKKEMILPGGAHWEHVKWSFKCSGLVGITAVDHLVGVHLILSNFLTQASKSQLSAGHPLRRLLDIHTYNTIEINAAAARTLCAEGGLVHHASALTEEGLAAALHYGAKTQQYDGIGTVLHAQRIFDSGQMTREEWPFGADFLDFFNIVLKFVKGYVDVWYDGDSELIGDEELVAFHDALHGMAASSMPYLNPGTKDAKEIFCITIASAIVGVTGFHNHIGMVSEYLKDPTFMAAKIRAGETYADVQASFQAMNIAMLTGFKAPPLMGDYTHMLSGLKKEAQAKEVFKIFQEDLDAFSKSVEARNKDRTFICNAFNPRLVLSSVSI